MFSIKEMMQTCFVPEGIYHLNILAPKGTPEHRERQIQNPSHVMAELNIIHLFREGNGRAIRKLIRCMALQYGLCLNWGNTDRDTLINAAIQWTMIRRSVKC